MDSMEVGLSPSKGCDSIGMELIPKLIFLISQGIQNRWPH